MTPAIEVVDVTALTARVDAAGDAVADARWAFDRCPCDRHNVELLGAVLAYQARAGGGNGCDQGSGVDHAR